MAIVTLTYTANMAESARAVHAGVNALTFSFDPATAWGTACDVCLLGRIPRGATITGGYVSGYHIGATGVHCLLLTVDGLDYSKSNQTIKFDQASGTFTLSGTAAGAQFNITRPLRISLSADSTASDAVLYLNATTGASATTSFSIAGTIYYVCDGRETSD